MPKRTGAMLETQTTPEPSAAKASLMDGVRATCRPTRPLLRARKKNVSRALPGPPLQDAGGAACWASRRRVPPPVPVHSLCSLQDDGALSTQTLTLQALQARTTANPSNCRV